MLPDEIDTLVQAVYEEQIETPEDLAGTSGKGIETEDGAALAHGQANQAIIGLPDDASWNEPGRFVLYDEDEPGVHRTLMAQTRLGEDSVVVIPLNPKDKFLPDDKIDFVKAKEWSQRAVALSRVSVVKKPTARGVPEGWKKSPLLRNCYPLELDAAGRWQDNGSVRLDDDLGIVYEAKEAT